MTPEEKFKLYLSTLPGSYMVESFYSVWKPEAKHIVTIINIPLDKHNEIYSLAVRQAAAMYSDQPIPFIINVGTRASTSSEDIEPILGFPKYNDPIT